MTTPRKDGGESIPRKTTIKRWKYIEAQYLNGFNATQIHAMLPKQFRVVHGTVKNDIVQIRKRWAEDASDLEKFDGRHRYLASLREIRTLSIESGDIKLASQMDKDIAKLSGVRFMSDEQTVHMDIRAARDYVKNIMEIVMRHVTDPEQQQAIISDIEALNDAEPGD